MLRSSFGYRIRPSLVVLFALLFSAHCTSAQDNQSDGSAVKLMLSPQAAPQPMLKYTLLPAIVDQRPGNAAVHYGKVKAEQNNFFASKEIARLIEKGQEAPLSELKDDHELDVLVNSGSIYANMLRGARCNYVDWQLPIREVFFPEILLPEVSEARNMGRILAARARIQVSRGDFAGAVESIQVGLALARHVSQGETLINGLVGASCAQLMLGVIQDLIAQPGAPNLYWALADLPSPLIDVRPGLEAERYILYFTEPGWLQPEKLEGDQEFWQGELERLWKHIKLGDTDGPVDDAQLPMYVVAGYASAKQRLVERGFAAAAVEAMPVAQVVVLDTLHQYNCNRDWHVTQLRQAMVEPARLAELQLKQSPYPEVLPVSEFLGLRTLPNVPTFMLGLERRRAALMAIEAIRLHAAEHGKLPAKLEDVQQVHVPIDPRGGKAFTYNLQGDSAVLSSAIGNPPLKYELQMRP